MKKVLLTVILFLLTITTQSFAQDSDALRIDANADATFDKSSEDIQNYSRLAKVKYKNKELLITWEVSVKKLSDETIITSSNTDYSGKQGSFEIETLQHKGSRILYIGYVVSPEKTIIRYVEIDRNSKMKSSWKKKLGEADVSYQEFLSKLTVEEKKNFKDLKEIVQTVLTVSPEETFSKNIKSLVGIKNSCTSDEYKTPEELMEDSIKHRRKGYEENSRLAHLFKFKL